MRVVHVMGDRRDHFDTLHDVWEMFSIILDERKKREIDPTVAILRECSHGSRIGLSWMGDPHELWERLPWYRFFLRVRRIFKAGLAYPERARIVGRGVGAVRYCDFSTGHTLLSGTTWYELRMGPGVYWRLWSDCVVHQIHLRVLEHIRSLAETQMAVNPSKR